MTEQKYQKHFKDRVKVKVSGMEYRAIGAITLWVALFWGNPDIADAIIKYLMTAHEVCEP